jgi:hypothetical protein
MDTSVAVTSLSAPETSSTAEVMMRVRIKSMEIPPVKDGLVVGTKAAIGVDAMIRTLRVLSAEEYERLQFTDEHIEDVLIKSAILRKVGRERLVRFVTKNLKPIMVSNELLMLDINVELVIEDVQ